MRVEIPEYTRCFFCFPLRYGLIVWGYIRLFAAFTMLVGISFTVNDSIQDFNRYRTSAGFVVMSGIGAVLIVLDLMLNAMFLVGSHKKNLKFIKRFYVYTIVLLAVTFAVDLYRMFGYIPLPICYPYDQIMIFLDEFHDDFSMLLYLVLQIYFILLLRSEIIVLEKGHKYRILNNGNKI